MADLDSILPIIVIVGGWIINRLNARKAEEQKRKGIPATPAESPAAPESTPERVPADPFENLKRFFQDLERAHQEGNPPVEARRKAIERGPEIIERPRRERPVPPRPAPAKKDRVIRPEAIRPPVPPSKPLSETMPLGSSGTGGPGESARTALAASAAEASGAPVSRRTATRRALRGGPAGLKTAVVLSEVLGRPVSLR